MFEFLFQILIHGVALAISLYIISLFTIIVEYNDTENNDEYKHELYSLEKSKEKLESKVDLTLLIPCYNETKRLPKMIETTVKLINSNSTFNNKQVQIIMVNDGSKDNTWELIKETVKKYENNLLVGLNYQKNGGKGYAVRSGMKHSKGEFVLMVDADGATDVNEIPRFYNLIIDKLRNKLPNEQDPIIIGSRNIINDEKEANRTLIRKLPSMVNSFFVKNLIRIKGIKDTQCGFKIFTQNGKNFLFSKMHLNRWAFDVELLYLAQANNFLITEEPINWQEMAGGSLNLLSAPISFFRDYFGILTFYAVKYWKTK